MSETACGSPLLSPQFSSLVGYPRDEKRLMSDALRKSTVCPLRLCYRYLTHAPEMNWEAREALCEMDSDVDWGIAHDPTDMVVDEAFDSAPPGRDGAELSHEGGEFCVYKHLISELKLSSGQ